MSTAVGNGNGGDAPGAGGGGPSSGGSSGGGKDEEVRSQQQTVKLGSDSGFGDVTDTDTEAEGPSNNQETIIDDDGSEIDRAIQSSVSDNVGAYSVVPGAVPRLRERTPNSSSHPEEEDQQAVAEEPVNTDNSDAAGYYQYSATYLPPNIDIIAEATLVVDNNDSSPADQTIGEENIHDENVEGDETSRDTFGLPWDAGPRLGGAEDINGSASVADMSAITTPTALHTLEEGDNGQQPTGNNRAALDASCEQGGIISSATTPDLTTSEIPIVVEATPVNDGPYAFLETKVGKIALSFIAFLLVSILTIGLSVGLTRGNDSINDEPKVAEEREYVRVPTKEERETGVLVFTGGDFCPEEAVALMPQELANQLPSSCYLGGILHQAIVDAQRRPHPFCPEDMIQYSLDFVPGESLPFTQADPHFCQISNLTPDISLLNAGAVRGGELFADSPITESDVANFLPFTKSKIAYLQVSSDDLVRIINNALSYATQSDPLQLRFLASLPVSSGVRYDINLHAPRGEQATNIQVLSKGVNNPGNPGAMEEDWIPIEDSTTQSYYWIVTNDYIATGGDSYLDGTEPQFVGITDLTYRDELIKYLEGLDGTWDPPSSEELSYFNSWFGSYNHTKV